MTDKTLIFANSKDALALIPEALVGAKALEVGGDTAAALITIPGVTANSNEQGGAEYSVGKVPSTAVNGGHAEVFGETPMTLNLKSGEAITVGGMLETALTAKGVAMPAAKPGTGLKR